LVFFYRRFGKHADSATLLQLYKSFIRPHLEYCAIVWNPYLVGDIESFEKVQRFALRVCLKNWSCEREDLYTQSGIPVLELLSLTSTAGRNYTIGFIIITS
jgi:hypothetical protein